MKTLKWIAGALLVVVTAGALTGCYVESRPYHHYPHRVIVVR